MRRRRRRSILLVMAIAGVPLVVAATAWACAALTTLRLDTRTATPGTAVSGVGRNYSSLPIADKVEVRFGGRRGPVVWSGTPDSSGKIKPTFKVPAGAKPGSYVVMATQSQLSPSGGKRAVAGTPGRFPLRVTSAGGSARSAAAGFAWGPTGGSGSGGAATAPAAAPPGGGGAPTIALGLLSLGLLAGGVTLVGRGKVTRSYRPQSV